MSFSTPQIRKLRTNVRPQFIRERQLDGKVLPYVEAWHVIAEANRVFGHDGWDRETIFTQCIWQKQLDGRYGASYVARVRITVRADGITIIREGFGAGEAFSLTPGQAHERAVKTAETDATKRALSTFGNCFGLALYQNKAPAPRPVKFVPQDAQSSKERARAELAEPVDASDTVSPMVSDADESPVPDNDNLQPEIHLPEVLKADNASPGEPERTFITGSGQILRRPASAPSIMARSAIDKSELLIREPKRHRNLEHLRFVATKPCLVCGRQPSDAHHLRFTQPRALGKKVSDEYTVPLCRFHHDEVHRAGKETNWWKARGIDPVAIAYDLWLNSVNGKTDVLE